MSGSTEITRIKLFQGRESDIDRLLDKQVNEWIENNGIKPLSIKLKLQAAFGDLYAVIMVTYVETISAG